MHLQKNIPNFLAKPGFSVKYENEDETLKVNNKTSLAYLLTDDEGFDHSLFLVTKTDGTYTLSDETSIKANLDAYAYTNFVASVKEHTLDGGLIAIVNPKLEATNKNGGKFTNTLKLDGRYAYVLYYNIYKDFDHYHLAGVTAELESKYANFR